MKEYKCEDCNKIFSQKCHFINHKNRKNKCNAIKEDNICKYCNKEFTKKSSLTRHIKNVCYKEKEIYKKLEELEKEKNKLEKQLNKKKKLDKKILDKQKSITNNITNNIINNNITNNNNITINLYPYGKEDMDRIDKRYIEKAINKIFYSPLELVKQVHFNDKYPEYHNIFIPNIKGNYIKIHRGDNKWDIVPKKEYIDELYVNKKNYIEDKYYENKDKYSNIKQERLDKFIDSENDGKTATDIKKYIEYLLYNEKCKPLILQRKLNEYNIN